jgi:hypothetical protein
MIHKIALSQNWAVLVEEDSEGNLTHRVTPHLILPFTTKDKFELLDYPSFNHLAYKLKMANLKVARLEQQVKDGYDPQYWETYFKEKKIDAPDILMMQKTVCLYSEFLGLTIPSGENKWSEKMREIKALEISRADKDAERIKLFTEFYYEKEKGK